MEAIAYLDEPLGSTKSAIAKHLEVRLMQGIQAVLSSYVSRNQFLLCRCCVSSGLVLLEIRQIQPPEKKLMFS